ncbi:carbohydrate-binding protein [Actinacidiphila acidipaludis]|uniref:Carbohydrate-binding protein n=1 Tax=Actinacidiphila acidipaludis TaxID=2873382 RepID=A0ABS7Q8V9_9ACTN|nr:carbohydrate-binding protein [Streptomyces acidipaludis]MBY8878880.1 carbohydrate-binding protein [Streptomyces acidipaludis]
MTAGHEGTPENDDPFAYLYRSEGGEEQDPAGAQRPAYPQPRTSYNQVQRVGERRSPQQQPPATGGYGYPPQQQYGGATQQYPQQQYTGATQQYPQQQYGGQGGQQYGGQGTREFGSPPPGGHRGAGQQGGGGGGTPNRKGLLIGAVAVVAAVAIGIAFAMTNGSGGDKGSNDKAATTPPSVASTAPSSDPSPSATPTQFDSGKTDASTLTLGGGAEKSTQWPGAAASGGTYVDGLGTAGATVTWTVTVPEDGPYTYFIDYGNAGQTANLGLAVNGKPRSNPVNLPNYGNYTDWSKAWDNTTYQWVDLKKGANTLTLTCMPNTNCGVNLDQVWLKQGQVKK